MDELLRRLKELADDATERWEKNRDTQSAALACALNAAQAAMAAGFYDDLLDFGNALAKKGLATIAAIRRTN